MNERLKHFPISYFAMILGLSGVTIAFQKVETILKSPFKISNSILIFTLFLFVIVSLIYFAKGIIHFKDVKEEFHHPIKMNFFPAFSIVLLLMGIAFLEIDKTTSKVFWFSGVILHSIFTLTIATKWIDNNKLDIAHINPAWFIPIVGNILVPIAGVHHVSKEFSYIFFSIGIIFWLVLFSMLKHRIFFHSNLPEKLIPTMFIMVAPPAVGVISYFKLSGEIDIFARLLYYFALFTFIWLLFQWKKFVKIPFYLSFWAYSFPIAAMGISTMLIYHQLGFKFFKFLSIGIMSLLSVVVIYLIFRTIYGVIKREICLPE